MKETKVMGKEPNFTGECKMSDVAISDVSRARNLIIEIAGDCWNGKGDMLNRVYDACQRHHKKFTRRRLRSFFHREAAGVRFHEMVDLAEVATLEKERKELIANARQEHSDFIKETTRLVAVLESGDADFHSDQLEALRCISGRVGCAGDCR